MPRAFPPSCPTRTGAVTVALVLSTGIALLFLGGALLINKEISKTQTYYEDKLNVSRQTHAAVEALRGKARSGDWQADAWADVLDVFCRHASRLPRRLATFPSASTTPAT